MLSVSYAGKNAYSADKTSGVLRGGALEAIRGYVLAHCAPSPFPPIYKLWPSFICKLTHVQNIREKLLKLKTLPLSHFMFI